MWDFMLPSSSIAWPFAILLAWILGEFGARFIHLPRITVYGFVGFLLGSAQTGFLPAVTPAVMLQIANVAFGLILFEVGYRINMRWLWVNGWIGITGVVEAGLTFLIVYLIAIHFGMVTLNALLLASLVMSTSPAGILCVINEQRSSGQVTERILHLSAINCVAMGPSNSISKVIIPSTANCSTNSIPKKRTCSKTKITKTEIGASAKPVKKPLRNEIPLTLANIPAPNVLVTVRATINIKPKPAPAKILDHSSVERTYTNNSTVNNSPNAPKFR